MIYPIVVYGDAVLRKRAADIAQGTDLTQLIADMFETMYAAHGIGLAAPQIGKSVRLFIVDGTTLEEEPTLKDFKQSFINPVILKETGTEWEFEEGCLSIPNIREDVFRKEKIKVRYYDEKWQLKEEEFDGIESAHHSARVRSHRRQIVHRLSIALKKANVKRKARQHQQRRCRYGI
jgi:peptide deformylase